jgi:iron complex outermembrane receptor protein
MNRFQLNLRRRLITAASGIALTTTGQAALAQDPTPASATGAPVNVTSPDQGATNPDEIIVTARKRPERLIKVPDTITVFTAKDIEDARIRNIGDFAAQTPGFEIKQGQGNGFFQMSIRGITQTNGGEAPVAMVVDGVTLPYSTAFSRPLFDIAQIEVLKGPQGALYGQNAIGGAVIITTKAPSNSFEGQVTAGVSTHHGYDALASISGPLVKDKLLFRVAGYLEGDGGDEKYVFIPDKRAGKLSRQSLRGDLTFNINDRLSAVIGGDVGHANDPGRPLVPRSLSAGTGLPAGLVDQFIVLGKPSQDVAATSKLNYWSLTSKANYQADFATITWISAFQEADERHVTDLDVSELPFIYVDQQNPTKAFSQELRFTSNGGGPFHWVFGGYASWIKRGYRNNPIAINVNFPGSLDPADANYVPVQRVLQTQHWDSYALFGQADYDITPKLQLSFGGRYDHDPRRNRVETFAGDGTTAIAPTLDQKATFNKFQPKVSARYSFTPDANVYVTAAKGFRPGGFNDGLNANVVQAFPPELTTTIELGGKFAMLDHRVFLDLAGYTTDYRNQQLSIISIGTGGATESTFNIDKTHIKGFEADLRARPVDDLELTAGYSYIDARIKEFGDALSGPQFDPSSYVGNRVPLVSKTSFNGTAQYTVHLSNDWNGVLRGEVEHKGSLFWAADNRARRNPYTLINLSAAVQKNRWELRVYGENVTNREYDVVFLDNLFTGAPGGFDFAFISRGSRFGVEAKMRF